MGVRAFVCDRHGLAPYLEKLYDAVSHDFDIDEIINSADRKLFSQITQPRLSTSSPPSHDFNTLPLQSSEKTDQLPHVEYSQYKISFITRCPFNFRWLRYDCNGDVFKWQWIRLTDYIDYLIIAFFRF